MSRYRDRYYSYSFYAPGKSKGERMADAEKAKQALEKKGVKLSPVVLKGSAIATTVWGKAWCKNIESYQDYSNRLPRGRSYVRSRSIIDLQIERGLVRAQVRGSSLYKIEIAVTPASKQRWGELCAACAGKIGSLVELLQGRISSEVMAVMANPESGLFPKPSEIKLKCSCPDIARLCKHLAAVLYGIGSRLDTAPELLFMLRGVDAGDLIAQAADMPAAVAETADALADDDLAEVFGVDIDVGADTPTLATTKKRGHSPKAVATATETAATIATRRRGRPKKVAAMAPAVEAGEVVAAPPKRRGRPPKATAMAQVEAVVAAVPKRRGRPRKISG